MLDFLNRLLCPHKETLTRIIRATDTRPGRMFTECMACGQQSKGVAIGRVMSRGGADLFRSHEYQRRQAEVTAH